MFNSHKLHRQWWRLEEGGWRQNHGSASYASLAVAYHCYTANGGR